MLLSALYVRFRDVADHLVGRGHGALLRDADPLPDRGRPRASLRTVELFNPLTPIFVQARVWIIDPGAPSASPRREAGRASLISIAVFVLVCLLGFWVFRREAPRIAEAL